MHILIHVTKFSQIITINILWHPELTDGISSNEILNYNEFVAAAMCKRISVDEERLHIAFELLDTQSSGHISMQSIRNVLMTLKMM